jgi:hypothetical protein
VSRSCSGPSRNSHHTVVKHAAATISARTNLSTLTPGAIGAAKSGASLNEALEQR